MTEDDRDPFEPDLAAWQPPPPPPGLADVVIARMREPAGVAAVDLAGSGGSRRWIAVGAAFAVAAAVVIALAVWPRGEAPAGTSGQLSTVGPSHVELGGASEIALEPRTELAWAREGRRIRTAQPRGTATYRVADADTLVIDAGATVASVEASGASLRVEVQMIDRADLKTMGATTVAAALAAIVTVVVYEGHVKVAGAGQVVEVPPGGVVEVRAGSPPRPTELADRSELEELRARLARQEEELARLRQRLAEQPRDEVTMACEPATVAAAESRGRAAFTVGDHAAALAAFDEILDCKPSLAAMTYTAACRAHSFRRARALFQRLPQDKRTYFKQTCISEGFDPRRPAPEVGVVRVQSDPPFDVIVDGDPATRRETPAKLELPVGKHKITFLRGTEKFTYSVTVEAGKVTSLSKHFD